VPSVGLRPWLLLIGLAASLPVGLQAQESSPATPAGSDPPVRIWQPETQLRPGGTSTPGSAAPDAAPPGEAGAPGVPVDPRTGERLAVPGRERVLRPPGARPMTPPAGPPAAELPVTPPLMAPPPALPPGAMAPLPPGALPPGAMPPGALPPGAMPPGALPPGALPPGALPPDAGQDAGRRPPVDVPPDVLPPPADGAPGSGPAQQGATSSSGANPWLILVPIAAIAGAVSLFLIERRRRRSSTTAVASDGSPSVNGGQRETS
jgi:hypothetical protein